jgi:hypothetical protein
LMSTSLPPMSGFPKMILSSLENLTPTTVSPRLHRRSPLTCTAPYRYCAIPCIIHIQ